MTGLTLLGMVMLIVMIFAIFIGFPISFTLLFLALTFGYFGLGQTVFSLAYFQTIGLMKEELLIAVPLFIFMGFITEQRSEEHTSELQSQSNLVCRLLLEKKKKKKKQIII